MRECPMCEGLGMMDGEPCPRCTLPDQSRGSGFIYPDERPVPLGESPLDRRKQFELVE